MVLEKGGSDFIRKPFREDEVFRMLNKHLGIKFRYDSKTRPRKLSVGRNVPSDLLISQFSSLPKDIISRLAEATELSDALTIGRVIEDIERHNAQLAGVLSDLAENYSYDELLIFIEKANETARLKRYNSGKKDDCHSWLPTTGKNL